MKVDLVMKNSTFLSSVLLQRAGREDLVLMIRNIGKRTLKKIFSITRILNISR